MDDGSSTSKRSELKKLIFQKNAELKKCKTKAEKEAVELKYSALSKPFLDEGAAEAVPVIEPMVPPEVYRTTEVSRSQKKKEQKLREIEQHRAAVLAEVGDGSAQVRQAREEMQTIRARLPERVQIVDIAADGDCMFASIAMQTDKTSGEIRGLVADFLKDNDAEFGNFIDSDFETYCEDVRSTAWGSDVELEALARRLQRPVIVYMRDRVAEFGQPGGEPIRLSFHENQYSSPHYNAVIPVDR